MYFGNTQKAQLEFDTGLSWSAVTSNLCTDTCNNITAYNISLSPSAKVLGNSFNLDVIKYISSNIIKTGTLRTANWLRNIRYGVRQCIEKLRDKFHIHGNFLTGRPQWLRWLTWSFSSWYCRWDLVHSCFEKIRRDWQAPL